MSIGLLSIFIIKAITAILINRSILKFVMHRHLELQEHIMDAYQNMPYKDYIKRNSSEYIQTLSALVSSFTGGALTTILRLSSEGIVLGFVFILLAIVNGPALFLLVSIIGITLLIYDQYFRSEVRQHGEKVSFGAQKMIQGIQEGLQGFKEIRILGKSDFFKTVFLNGAKQTAKSQLKTQLISTAPRYILELNLILFIVLFVLGSLLFDTNIQRLVPTLGVFAFASVRMLPSANLFIGGLTNLRFSRYATSQLYKELNHLDENKYFQESLTINDNDFDGPKFSNLQISNLYFKYAESKEWVLKDINLNISTGESIGLIGPSGSGKTTLVDLILGLLGPNEGEIKYNKINLFDILDHWRSQIAYLPQEIFLIDNTLCQNIALATNNNDLNKDRIVKSLAQAKLNDLVAQLPEGINTLLGERGVRLSGGQRQRVALARAFYHRRNILVMDEATSALDNQTEKEIVSVIQQLKGKTLIVIAHRLSTVKHCDRIYRLDQGRIVQVGKFEEVVNNG